MLPSKLGKFELWFHDPQCLRKTLKEKPSNELYKGKDIQNNL